MKEILLCKYGEIVLKGANRGSFESLLQKEIRYRLSGVGSFRVSRAQSTVYVEPGDDTADMDAAFGICRRVFGIAAVGRAAVAEKNMEAITAAVKSYLPPLLEGKKTFKVEAKRSDKTFPLTSPEISAVAGGALLSACPWLRVNVRDPEVTVRRLYPRGAGKGRGRASRRQWRQGTVAPLRGDRLPGGRLDDGKTGGEDRGGVF